MVMTTILLHTIKMIYCCNMLNYCLLIIFFIWYHLIRLLYFILFSSFDTQIISLQTLEKYLLISLSTTSSHIVFNYVVIERSACNMFMSKTHWAAVQHSWLMLLYKYYTWTIVTKFIIWFNFYYLISLLSQIYPFLSTYLYGNMMSQEN